MHCKENTLQGQFAFEADYADERMSELEYLWDELPERPILALWLVESFVCPEALGVLRDCERYYFSNEAVCSGTTTVEEDGMVSTRPHNAVLVAKTIGGISGNTATEYRLDLTDPSKPVVTMSTFPASEVKFATHAMKAGITK